MIGDRIPKMELFYWEVVRDFLNLEFVVLQAFG